MFNKNCRCGASNKNFQFDIGPFFINQCCLDAGFDKLGNKVLDEKENELANNLKVDDDKTLDQEPSETETTEEVVESEPEVLNGDITDDMVDHADPDEEPVTEAAPAVETPAEKKAREKAEKKAAKAAAKGK